MKKIICTPRECAELLCTSLTVIYSLLESGELPAYRQGKNWKIPMKALEDYVMDRAMFEAEGRMNHDK